MKKIFIILIALLAVFAATQVAQATPITFPINGGTGTGTIPSYGQVLVGNAGGTYTPTATSTLGISGGSSASSTLLTDNNTFSGRNIFSNMIGAQLGSNTPIANFDLEGGSTALLSATGDASLFQDAGYFDSPFIHIGEYQNFLLQTEALNTVANWISNVGVIGTNNGIGPDGSLIAEDIPAGTTATSGIFQEVATALNGCWTFSAWLKAQSGTGTTTLEIDDGTGTATTTNAGNTVNLTTNWQRYAVSTCLNDSHTLLQADIWNGTTAIVAWGTQLEQSTTTRTYSGAQTTIAQPAISRSIHVTEGTAFASNITVGTTMSNAGTYTDTINALTAGNNIGDAVILSDASAATAVAPQQQSPRIRFSGLVWNNGISTTTSWTEQMVPISTSTGQSFVGSTLNFNVLNATNNTYFPAFTLNSGTTSASTTTAPYFGFATTSPSAEVAINATSSGRYPNNLVFLIASTTPTTYSTLFSVSNTGTTTLGQFGTCSGSNALQTSSSGVIQCGAITAGSAASSTLLSDNNTFSGNNTFSTNPLTLSATTGTTTIASGQGFTIGGSQFVVQQGSGFVGIGNSSPDALLSLDTSIKTIKIAAYDGGANALYGMGVNSGELTFGAGIAAAGTPQMVIKSNGNVGIGTTTPQYNLVVSAAAPTIDLAASGDTTDLNANWLLTSGYTASATSTFSITNAGAGFGSGGVAFQVMKDAAGNGRAGLFTPAGLSAVFGIAANVNSDLSDGLVFTTNNSANGIYSPIKSVASAISSNGQRLYSGVGLSTEVFNVMSNGQGYFAGNVGIGTTTPSNLLTIQSAANPTLSIWNAAFGGWGANITSDNGGQMIFDDTRADCCSNILFQNHGATTRMEILDNGNVGIGTTTPVSLLDVAGGTSGDQLRLSSSNGQSYWSIGRNTTDGSLNFSGNQNANINFLAGNVGIGTTTPFAKLSIAGSTYLGGNFTATGTVQFTGITNGLLSADASGNITASTSIGTNYLTGNLATINGTTIANGGTYTITAASSTLLANNNTFSGNNVFSASTTINAQLNLQGATTTLLTTGALWDTSISSALALFDANHKETAYAGASACGANNFVTALSAVGGTTCGTAAISGVNLGSNLGSLSTNASLTGTSYNGSAAVSDWGLNLTNPNSWTGLQTMSAASTTNFTAGSSNLFFVASTGEVSGFDNLTAASGQISPMRYISIPFATTTVWTATSSAASPYADKAVVVMPFTGTLRTISCWTNAGTLEFSTTVNGGTSNYLPASTTAGTYTLSSAFTRGATTTIIAGNPASAPTIASCTMGVTQTI